MCQIIQVVYLGYVKPYDTRAEYYLDLFNEAFIFVLLYHTMFFTDNNTEQEYMRKVIGISMIFFTVAVVLINLSIIVIPGVKKAILICRKRWLIRRARKLEEQKNKRLSLKLKAEKERLEAEKLKPRFWRDEDDSELEGPIKEETIAVRLARKAMEDNKP